MLEIENYRAIGETHTNHLDSPRVAIEYAKASSTFFVIYLGAFFHVFLFF